LSELRTLETNSHLVKDFNIIPVESFADNWVVLEILGLLPNQLNHILHHLIRSAKRFLRLIYTAIAEPTPLLPILDMKRKIKDAFTDNPPNSSIDPANFVNAKPDADVGIFAEVVKGQNRQIAQLG